MVFRVRLSPRALKDVESAYIYYAEIDGSYAWSWYDGLEAALESPTEFPLRCSLAFEPRFFSIPLRQQLYGKGAQCYRILFTVHEDEVRVHHIRHCRQEPISTIDPRDEDE